EQIPVVSAGDHGLFMIFDNGRAFMKNGSIRRDDSEVWFSLEKTITPKGVTYRGRWYWASWMAQEQGRKVLLRFPSKPGALMVADKQTKQHIGVAYRTEAKTADRRNEPADRTPFAVESAPPSREDIKEAGDVAASP